MGKAPKEDPADKAARLRERRLSGLDRNRAAQEQAGQLTSDLRAIYGFRGLPLGGLVPSVAPTTPAATRPGKPWGSNTFLDALANGALK